MSTDLVIIGTLEREIEDLQSTIDEQKKLNKVLVDELKYWRAKVEKLEAHQDISG